MTSPVAFGLPEKFDTWRTGQDKAFWEAARSDRRWTGLCLPTGCGKSALYMALAAANEWRTLILTATRGLQDQISEDFRSMGLVDVRGMCVAPETRVLTSDLRWVEVGSVQIGDALAGFEEHGLPNRRRKWKRAEITSARRLIRPCYKLTFASGAVVTCSSEHRWLVKSHHSGVGNDIWLSTADLKSGLSQVKRVFDPWEIERSYDAGWLAAAWDGEGSLSHSNQGSENRSGKGRICLQLTFVQSVNSSMLAEFKGRLTNLLGAANPIIRTMFKDHPRYQAAETVTLASQRAILTALGRIRPNRLLAKLDWSKIGSLVGTPDLLVEKADVGNRLVVALTTSTGTFIAEGLASHNSNYPCLEKPGSTCADGDCRLGWKCPSKPECDYYNAVDTAKAARMVVSNYKFYFHNATRLNAFDCVVMDEAHEVAALLADHVALRLSEWDKDALQLDWPRHKDTHASWRAWAGAAAEKAERLEEQAKTFEPVRVVVKLKDLREKLEALAKLPDDWLIAETRGGWTFEPVWPTAFADAYLWRKTEKIVLSSATFHPRGLELLGVGHGDYDWIEAPSPFPIANRLVHVVPIEVRVQHGMSEQEKFWWVRGIDRVIDRNLDKKGIIHTVSYDRAKFLKATSKHRAHMLVHDPRTTRQVVQQFRASEAPALLVSPSVTTGWDFPDTESEYQVIAKIPFPDQSGAIMKARTKLDPTYPYFMAVTTLVQMAGRIVRSESDKAATYITDDHARWFLPRWGKRFAPRWFMEAVRWDER